MPRHPSRNRPIAVATSFNGDLIAVPVEGKSDIGGMRGSRTADPNRPRLRVCLRFRPDRAMSVRPDSRPLACVASRILRLRGGAQLDRAAGADVVEMSGEKIARRAPAAVAQAHEEIIVRAQLARCG